jgi:sporulation protein YlmC with PRC-barrel domain
MSEICDNQIWISYQDDDGSTRSGFFILIEQTANYVKIKSGSNVLIIPYHKINKIKERLS